MNVLLPMVAFIQNRNVEIYYKTNLKKLSLQ